jgi:hypothetical protein
MKEGLIMLNATKVLELAQSGDTLTIIAMAEKEIIEAAAKVSGGSTLLKRTRAAAKYIEKCDEFRRGAWVDDKEQLFTNGYTGFFLNPSIDGLQEAPVTARFDIRKCIPNTDKYITVEVDPADVTAKLKIWKAQNPGAKKSGKPCIYEVGESLFNAEYVLDCFNILGGQIVFKIPANGELTPAVLTSENGTAILLPVRKNK